MGKRSGNNVNIRIDQGATFDRTFVWKSNNVAKDLTGYIARIQIRETPDAASPLYNKTQADADITITAATGTIEWNISATDTAALDFDRALWALEMEDGSGNVTRLLEGNVRLSKEVVK